LIKNLAEKYFEPFVELFKDKKRVLDLGCGQGIFLKILKKVGVDAVGVEIDDSLSQMANSQGLKVIQADIFDYLKETTDKFDGCCASHIVEHFTPGVVKNLFRLIHRIMEAGGLLLVVTPNIANLRRAAGDFWRDPTHVRPYPISALNKLLAQSGWETVKSGYHTDRPYSLRRQIIYGLRNLLIGRYWGDDDLYVVAQKI
jgi:SAM-dependent methyltransferase